MEKNYLKRTCCDESKPYIFISYAHKDSDKVFEIINNLIQNGFNVWWDEGIDPGTEWDENIAEHVKGCGYFIACMSNNYVDSNNCKDELNYARDLDKDQLLLYLEECNLPSGMAMRLNRLQSVYMCNYPDKNDAFAKLYEAKGINVAKISNEAPENWKPLEKKDMPKKSDNTGKIVGITLGCVAIVAAIIVGIFFIKYTIEDSIERARTEESDEKSDKEDKKDKDSDDDKDSDKDDKDSDNDYDDKPTSTVQVSQLREMYPEIIGNRPDNILNSSYCTEDGLYVKDYATGLYIQSLSVDDDKIYTIDLESKKAVTYDLDGTDMEYIEELEDFTFYGPSPYLLLSDEYYFLFFYYEEDDEEGNYDLPYGDLYCVDRKTGELLGKKEDMGYNSCLTFCDGYLVWVDDTGNICRCKAGDIEGETDILIKYESLGFIPDSVRCDDTNIMLTGFNDDSEPCVGVYSVENGMKIAEYSFPEYVDYSCGTGCLYDNMIYVPISDYITKGYMIALDIDTGDYDVIYEVKGIIFGVAVLDYGEEISFVSYDLTDYTEDIVTAKPDGRIIDVIENF